MIRLYVIAAVIALIVGVVLGEFLSAGSTVSLWDMGGHVLLALVLGLAHFTCRSSSESEADHQSGSSELLHKSKKRRILIRRNVRLPGLHTSYQIHSYIK